MVSQVRPREAQERGREEHSFVVWMGDQEDNGFVAEGRDLGRHDRGGVEPC